MNSRFVSIFLFVPIVALAQETMPTQFPDTALAPNADSLREHLAGKSFNVKPFNGASWRLEYASNGYVFLNTSTGYSDKGRWRVEDGKLCAEWTKLTSGCNEARLAGSFLLIKRHNGEVVTLVSR